VRVASAALVAFALCLFGAQTAFAAGDPYYSGDRGYDISWPQCGKAAPSVGSFAVIGVNGGSPFTGNLCMADQYAAAPRSAPPSLYINTGYEQSYRYLVTPGCRQQSHSIPGTDEGRMAWAIGCSEADTSITYAHAFGVESISMWWLDVEILNKWSLNLALNRYALQGSVTRLTQTGLPVGIYSSTPMWLMITGSLSAPGYISAEWNAAGSCSLPFTPLKSEPVWLAQHVYSDLDHDTAC
jgi:hypothetical protein